MPKKDDGSIEFKLNTSLVKFAFLSKKASGKAEQASLGCRHPKILSARLAQWLGVRLQVRSSITALGSKPRKYGSFTLTCRSNRPRSLKQRMGSKLKSKCLNGMSMNNLIISLRYKLGVYGVF